MALWRYSGCHMVATSSSFNPVLPPSLHRPGHITWDKDFEHSLILTLSAVALYFFPPTTLCASLLSEEAVGVSCKCRAASWKPGHNSRLIHPPKVKLKAYFLTLYSLAQSVFFCLFVFCSFFLLLSELSVWFFSCNVLTSGEQKFPNICQRNSFSLNLFI